MTGSIRALVADAGAISSFWGIMWFFWDKHAVQPGYLFAFGLTALLIGWAIP